MVLGLMGDKGWRKVRFLDWAEGVVLGLMNDEGWRKARFGLG